MEPNEATRMSDFITLPRAEEGFVAAVTTTADANGVNLTTIGFQQSARDISSSDTKDPIAGVVNHYITIQADGADVYIVAGTTQGQVTGANAPSIAANGKGLGGAPPGSAAGICFKIPLNQERSFIPRPGKDIWLGFVGAGTGQIRIFKTSI